MPIVIKEIEVSIIVEKKVIIPAEIPDGFYEKLKEKIIEELSEREKYISPERSKER